MSLCFSWSERCPGWLEVVCGTEVLAEIEVSFGLRKLPTTRFTSLEDARAWLVQKERSLAKNYALRCLTRQSLASTVLNQKLRARGFSDVVCEEVVASCQSFLSDDEYWQRVVEKELAKGYGPRYIAWKWKAKGLPSHWVERAATVEKQRAAIEKLLRKIKTERDAFRSLLQRGFEAEIIRSVLSR